MSSYIHLFYDNYQGVSPQQRMNDLKNRMLSRIKSRHSSQKADFVKEFEDLLEKSIDGTLNDYIQQAGNVVDQDFMNLSKEIDKAAFTKVRSNVSTAGQLLSQLNELIRYTERFLELCGSKGVVNSTSFTKAQSLLNSYKDLRNNFSQLTGHDASIENNATLNFKDRGVKEILGAIYSGHSAITGCIGEVAVLVGDLVSKISTLKQVDFVVNKDIASKNKNFDVQVDSREIKEAIEKFESMLQENAGVQSKSDIFIKINSSAENGEGSVEGTFGFQGIAVQIKNYKNGVLKTSGKYGLSKALAQAGITDDEIAQLAMGFSSETNQRIPHIPKSYYPVNGSTTNEWLQKSFSQLINDAVLAATLDHFLGSSVNETMDIDYFIAIDRSGQKVRLFRGSDITDVFYQAIYNNSDYRSLNGTHGILISGNKNFNPDTKRTSFLATHRKNVQEFAGHKQIRSNKIVDVPIDYIKKLRYSYTIKFEALQNMLYKA